MCAFLCVRVYACMIRFTWVYMCAYVLLLYVLLLLVYMRVTAFAIPCDFISPNICVYAVYVCARLCDYLCVCFATPPFRLSPSPLYSVLAFLLAFFFPTWLFLPSILHFGFRLRAALPSFLLLSRVSPVSLTLLSPSSFLIRHHPFPFPSSSISPPSPSVLASPSLVLPLPSSFS